MNTQTRIFFCSELTQMLADGSLESFRSNESSSELISTLVTSIREKGISSNLKCQYNETGQIFVLDGRARIAAAQELLKEGFDVPIPVDIKPTPVILSGHGRMEALLGMLENGEKPVNLSSHDWLKEVAEVKEKISRVSKTTFKKEVYKLLYPQPKKRYLRSAQPSQREKQIEHKRRMLNRKKVKKMGW